MKHLLVVVTLLSIALAALDATVIVDRDGKETRLSIPELYAKAMVHVSPTLSKTTELPDTLRELASSGARGVANGRGFYSYTDEEARHWEELYRKHAWRVTKFQNEYFPLQNK